jgi:hypothetical protein
MKIEVPNTKLQRDSKPQTPSNLRLFVGPRFWMAVSFCLMIIPGMLPGQTNSETVEQIPPLRPPHGEIPPGFWERHGQEVVLGALIVVVLLGAGIWFLVRPKPPILVSPEAQARQALESLRGQSETGVLLSKVSQILRHYVTAAFGLPEGELTTTEFCKLVAGESRIGEHVAGPMTEFLRRCDERKFAPQPPRAPMDAVTEAVTLIDSAQARLTSLHEAEAAQQAS